MKTVAWFSGGVSSAVAIKICEQQIDQIIYTHIDDQHPDTLRFVKDCETWFGLPIKIMQHQYKDVETACLKKMFIRTPSGAECTTVLKRRVRKQWEREQTEPLIYVWGLDCEEKKRADRLRKNMFEQKHVFPLIESGICKSLAHQLLRKSGIKRPMMYDLGYLNNNCIGCVKGGMGYWNKIRVDFPDVFEKRAKMERIIGASCINGCYLDELDPERGRSTPPIVEACGIMCELMMLEKEVRG